MLPRVKTPTSGVVMEALFVWAALVSSTIGVWALRAPRRAEKVEPPPAREARRDE